MNMNNTPLVSFITLNYNNTYLTVDFLRSLKGITYPHIEVIVVDNHSDVDPGPELKAVYPEVKIVHNSENLGFAGGNNSGIKEASGDYLFFINNDTVVSPHLVEPLLEVFKQYPDAGAVSPKFHYYFHKGIIEYAGYKQVNPVTGRNSMVGCGEIDRGQFNHVKETYYGHGGGMMIPRKVMAEIGGWPEIYFLYYEEFDLCAQIRKKGYKIYYQPACVIYHKVSMSIGKDNPLKTYYLNRNRILFMRRNVHSVKLFIFFFYLIFITIPKNLISYSIKKEWNQLRAFIRAVWWHIQHPILS